MKTIVKLDHVSKSFIKDKYVIKDLSLEVHEGWFKWMWQNNNFKVDFWT